MHQHADIDYIHVFRHDPQSLQLGASLFLGQDESIRHTKVGKPRAHQVVKGFGIKIRMLLLLGKDHLSDFRFCLRSCTNAVSRRGRYEEDDSLDFPEALEHSISCKCVSRCSNVLTCAIRMSQHACTTAGMNSANATEACMANGCKNAQLTRFRFKEAPLMGGPR